MVAWRQQVAADEMQSLKLSVLRFSTNDQPHVFNAAAMGERIDMGQAVSGNCIPPTGAKCVDAGRAAEPHKVALLWRLSSEHLTALGDLVALMCYFKSGFNWQSANVPVPSAIAGKTVLRGRRRVISG